MFVLGLYESDFVSADVIPWLRVQLHLHLSNFSAASLSLSVCIRMCVFVLFGERAQFLLPDCILSWQ